MRHALVIPVVVLLLSPAPLPAQSGELPVVELEVWTELDPFAADARPVDRSVAIGRLLDEAAIVLSAMVYGSEFRYIPADPAREVAEEFTLRPRATITRGDPGLFVTQTWVDGDLLYARMYYELRPDQIRWYEGWRSAAIATSRASGREPFLLGPAAKAEAYTDAFMQAVRAYARSVSPNRPRSISGALLMTEPPLVSIHEGSYEARVTISVQIDEIEPYSVF